MKSDYATRRLAQLHDAAERISANLVDLEIDSGRQLLEATRLDGESSRRWAAASGALTELWRRHGLLESLLIQADQLQSSRRPDQLAALLGGRSIELSSCEVPLAERELLASAEAKDWCSPDELLTSMSAAFDEVKAVVSQIGAAWELLVPRLDDTRRRLQAATALAGELGEGDRRDLETVARELGALSAMVTADPLSVQAAEVEALTRRLVEIQSELEDANALKRGFEARILEAHEAFERLRGARDAARAARDELLVKISVPAAPPPLRGHHEGEREIAEIAALAQRGAWSEARAALDAWTGHTNSRLDEAERLLHASRVPIDARNQLRALLDAYQVKAKRLGLLEDVLVADAFARAQAALYNAPTDLNVAAQLVRAYQETINGPPSASEAVP